MILDQHSAAGRLADLVRHELITTFVRCVAAALAVSMALLGYGPTFTPDAEAYENPVFDGAFRFASPTAWGIGFFTAAALLLISALSGRAVIYLIALTLSVITLAGWATMILGTAWTTDAVITSGAIGLYVGNFTALVGLALSPRQLATARPIITLVDGDAEPVRLRRVSA